jgi:hypothetical protein
VTKEEFIGRAADALMRFAGIDPEGPVDADVVLLCVEQASAALEAVGAWDFYESAKRNQWRRSEVGMARVCRDCGRSETAGHPDNCQIGRALAAVEGR